MSPLLLALVLCAAPVVFEDPQPMNGLTGQQCGVAKVGGEYLAVCTQLDPQSAGGSRGRPYSFTSKDLLTWSPAGPTVPMPSGIWNGSGFVATSPLYQSQGLAFPLALSSGELLLLSELYYQWAGPNWVPFIGLWRTDGGAAWRGYRGEAGDERYVLSFGTEWGTDIGAGAPAARQLADGSLVAYAVERPHYSLGPDTRMRFHRFTSADRERWTQDPAFAFDTGGYSGKRSPGRLLPLDEHYYVLSYRAFDDAGGCSATSQWLLAESSSGLGGTFAPDAERSRAWQVTMPGGAALAACDVLDDPFFMKEQGRLQIFYRTAAGWFTAREPAPLPPAVAPAPGEPGPELERHLTVGCSMLPTAPALGVLLAVLLRRRAARQRQQTVC